MIVNINPNNNNNNTTERIWAYLKLQQFATQKLIHNDMIEMDNDEKEEDNSLPLSLALKYKFVTPWTSMIVVKKKYNTKQQKEQKEKEETQQHIQSVNINDTSTDSPTFSSLQPQFGRSVYSNMVCFAC